MKRLVVFMMFFVLMMGGYAYSWGPHGRGMMMNGYSQQGASQGMATQAPVQSLFASGTPFSTEGTVKEIGQFGRGAVIDTGTETVTVYGLGPIWYWESQGLSYPAVGENVKIDGMEITLSDGTTRKVATSVSIGGTTVTLRDAQTGYPAWRSQSRGRGMRGGPMGMGGGYYGCENCPCQGN